MKTVFKTDSNWGSIDMEMQILELDEKEYIVELLAPNLHKSFWKRLKLVIKYLFKNESIIFTSIPLSTEESERLRNL